MNSSYEGFDDGHGLLYIIQYFIDLEWWESVTEYLTDLEFIEAKCVAKMVYDLLQDCDRVIQIRSNLRSVAQVRRALALSQPTLSDYPELTIQSVYNRLNWFDPLEPDLRNKLESARSDLDKRGAWICAEAPLPRSETHTAQSIVFGIESPIQSFSVDGRLIGVVNGDGNVAIYDLTGKSRPPGRKRLPISRIASIALGADAHEELADAEVAFIDWEGNIWPPGYPTRLVGRKGENLLVYHPRHGILATREDSALIWWQPEHDEATVLAKDLPLPLIVLHLCQDEQSVLFVAGFHDQMIGVSTWNGKDWATQTLPYMGPPVVDACLEPEARHVLLATIDRRLSMWDLDREECLIDLFYERRADCPLQGAPKKCILGDGPTKGWTFVATDTGQIAGWDRSRNILDRFEPYQLPDERATLVLMAVLPFSGDLFVTTGRQGRTVSRISSQGDQEYQKKATNACLLMPEDKVVSISERDHEIRWFSSKGMIFLGAKTVRFPTVLASGAEADSVLIGNQAGEVWQVDLETNLVKELLLHLGEPVVSLYYRSGDRSVIAAGKNGDVVRTSLDRRDHEKLWHSTGYQMRIKILPAGNRGLFWSLCRDERLEYLAVLSLVRDVDREEIVLKDSGLRDLTVATDGETICTAGREVQILQPNGDQWQCIFRRQEPVERVCFLGEDKFLTAVLSERLEVWKVAPDLPTVATIDLRPMGVKVTCLHGMADRIVAGCRSGDLMSFRIRSIG